MIAADANDPRGIVWIASYPKSGNTWLRLFLHHLLRIKRGQAAVEREIDRLGDTAPAIGGQVALFEKYLVKPLLTTDMRDIVMARVKVQEEMVRRAGPGVLPVKTHSFLGRVFDTPQINLGVSVGALYIVRNPLDIAVSLAPYLKVGLDEAIRAMGATLKAPPPTPLLVPEVWGSWSQNVLSWTTDPPPVIRVMRYEDLLDDPVAQFTAVAEHMRIEARRVEIEEAVAASSFAQAAREEQSGGFAERPEGVGRFFRVGRAGQWRDQLSAEQIDRIVTHHGDQMARFGYLPTETGRASA
jgi:Sulfotransferase domain